MPVEPEAPDLAKLRADLGLPPTGQRLTREQALSLYAAVDADREPIPEHAWAWARRALGLTARSA
jgi:hypothetical protein